MHLHRACFLQISFAAAIFALLFSLNIAEAKPLSLSRGSGEEKRFSKRASGFDGDQQRTQKLIQTFSGNAHQKDEAHHDQAASLHGDCEMLVNELKTASEDFALYMRVNCPNVNAESTEHNIPEHCQQSVHEAYELFDLYDTLLQEHCHQQYVALFTSLKSGNDRKPDNHNVADLTNEPNAIIL